MTACCCDGLPHRPSREIVTCSSEAIGNLAQSMVVQGSGRLLPWLWSSITAISDCSKFVALFGPASPPARPSLSSLVTCHKVCYRCHGIIDTTIGIIIMTSPSKSSSTSTTSSAASSRHLRVNIIVNNNITSSSNKNIIVTITATNTSTIIIIVLFVIIIPILTILLLLFILLLITTESS